MFKKIKFWLWKKGLCNIAGRASYKEIQLHVRQMKLVVNTEHYYFVPHSLLKTTLGYLSNKPALQGLLEGTWGDNSMPPERKKVVYNHVLSNAIQAAEGLCNDPS